MPTRSPLQADRAAACLHEHSERFVLGLGAGNPEPASANAVAGALVAHGGRFANFSAHGVPYSPPVDRMRSYLQCVLAALRTPSGDPVELETPHHRIGTVGRGLDGPALRVVVGASGPRLTRLAGELADGAVPAIRQQQQTAERAGFVVA